MNEYQPTPTDPRERLIAVGNQLLDVVYAIHRDGPVFTRLEAAQDNPELLAVLMKEDGAIEILLRMLRNGVERDRLVTEYTTLREAIENLTQGAFS